MPSDRAQNQLARSARHQRDEAQRRLARLVRAEAAYLRALGRAWTAGRRDKAPTRPRRGA